MMMMNMTYQMMTAGDTAEPHLTGICYNMGKAFGATFLLLGEDHGRERVIGYLVAMEGVDEVHLLNITVAPAWQGHGLGSGLLTSLCDWSRQRQAQAARHQSACPFAQCIERPLRASAQPAPAH